MSTHADGDCPEVEARPQIEAALIEKFRKALMVEHHGDWSMEVVSEAAHICARAWCDDFFGRADESGT